MNAHSSFINVPRMQICDPQFFPFCEILPFNLILTILSEVNVTQSLVSMDGRGWRETVFVCRGGRKGWDRKTEGWGRERRCGRGGGGGGEEEFVAVVSNSFHTLSGDS